MLETECRCKEPAPLIFACGVLNAIALGVSLIENAGGTAAQGNPTVQPKLVLGRKVILLLKIVGTAF